VNYLSEEHFVAAWKKLDAYYNTTEAIDTSSLMTYCTQLSYNPRKDGSLEQFIGNLNQVFTQLATAGNIISEAIRLGIIRGALDKGSNHYKDV
jgi:hypothetical protein